jgi:ABC-type sugar transport system ATPase subunit
MNFLPVALQRENGTLMLTAEGIRLPLAGELSAALDQVPPGTKVQIGIRPEHFTIAPDAEASDLFGTIRLVEPLGKDQYLHVSIGSEMIIVRADPEEEYHVGDDIRLTPSFKHLYFFEEETGKRIHIQHEVVPGELPLMAESATNPT